MIILRVIDQVFDKLNRLQFGDRLLVRFNDADRILPVLQSVNGLPTPPCPVFEVFIDPFRIEDGIIVSDHTNDHIQIKPGLVLGVIGEVLGGQKGFQLLLLPGES